MNFELTPDQRMMAETFARFMDERSSSVHIRAAADNNGFDAELWQGLAELGAFSLRVPEDQGGLGLGIMDAAVLMEEAGFWPSGRNAGGDTRVGATGGEKPRRLARSGNYGEFGAQHCLP